MIKLVLALLLVGTTFYLLVKKFQGATRLWSCLLAFVLFVLAYWLLTIYFPNQNAKMRIVHYMKRHYPIDESQIEIIERSPGEGEVLDFGDNQRGAIAFRLSKPVELNPQHTCENSIDYGYCNPTGVNLTDVTDINKCKFEMRDIQNYGRLAYELKKTVPSDHHDMESWKCAHHVIDRVSNQYKIYFDPKENLYYLWFSWNFG